MGSVILAVKKSDYANAELTGVVGDYVAVVVAAAGVVKVAAGVVAGFVEKVTAVIEKDPGSGLASEPGSRVQVSFHQNCFGTRCFRPRSSFRYQKHRPGALSCSQPWIVDG